MAARTREMEPRLIERLRAELAELFAATVAYPSYFDFRANRQATRPIDRARMEEIQRFLSSVNFGVIERSEVTSPETRRFIEQLILRYIDVNEGLRGHYAERYLPRLRALAPRLATDAQRRAIGYINGAVPDFGARRQTISWTSVTRRESGRSDEERERATRVLESALLQRPIAPPQEPIGAPVVKPPTPAAPPDPWRSLPNDVTVPVPAAGFPNSAPGVDSANAPAWRVSEQPTGPLASAQPAAQPARPVPMRELPSDLYQLYGDYLNDMAPEAQIRPATPALPPAKRPEAPAPPPRPVDTQRADATPSSAEARNDQLIFWQLRYQLEAYVRRAARSYGVPHQGGDPATVLDELRRSGFVDEADLRIAESVFALTDRVTAQGHATEQEYRQALMLYLLYHRSHLNI